MDERWGVRGLTGRQRLAAAAVEAAARRPRRHPRRSFASVACAIAAAHATALATAIAITTTVTTPAAGRPPAAIDRRHTRHDRTLRPPATALSAIVGRDVLWSQSKHLSKVVEV